MTAGEWYSGAIGGLAVWAIMNIAAEARKRRARSKYLLLLGKPAGQIAYGGTNQTLAAKLGLSTDLTRKDVEPF